jgi:enoyl-CoA hydratase
MGVQTESVIRTDKTDGIAVLRLAKPPVNALDTELLESLEREVTQCATDGVRAIVITGEGRAFSAGVDLRRLLDGGYPYTARLISSMSSCFATVYALPVPVVAAVNGHAIAGGCALALACDSRLISAGKFGLNELALGLPFPPAILEMIAVTLGDRTYSIITTAELHDPEAAFNLRMVDRIVVPEDLEEKAIAEASRLGSIPAPVFAATKTALRPSLKNSPTDPDTVADLARQWLTPENVEKIQSVVNR